MTTARLAPAAGAWAALAAPAVTAALAAALGGCGADGSAGGSAGEPEPRREPPPAGRRAADPPRARGGTPRSPLAPREAPLRRAACPAALAGCRAASGRVLYVERVDPDGDGDAHLVLASAAGVTAPGVTVVDVAARLRPDPLPKRGDRVSAAGPVYRGSYGQRQIEAVELHVARR